MTRFVVARPILAALLLPALVLCSPRPVLAGPPLICHPFDIGTARSLPFGDTRAHWKALDPSYDRARLVEDTLALLTPHTPVVVRMETLRRASAYVADDAALAAALLKAVRARAVERPRTDAEALALFDAAYLVDAYRQLEGYGTGLDRLAGGADGYAMLRTAMVVRGDDPAMHFAAALMTVYPDRKASHLQHLRKAREASRADVLVARNLASHFSN